MVKGRRLINADFFVGTQASQNLLLYFFPEKQVIPETASHK